MSRTKRIYNKPFNATHLYAGDTFCWHVYGTFGFYHPYKQLTNARHQYRWYWKHPKDTPRFWRRGAKKTIRREIMECGGEQ